MPFGKLGAGGRLGALGGASRFIIPPNLANTLYFVGQGTAWSAANSWATTSGGTPGSGPPTASQNAVFDKNSGAATIDAGAVCRALICGDDYTGTITHTAAVTLTIGDATAGYNNIALRLDRGMTYTLGNVATSAISFISTSATQQTIDLGGKTAGNVTINSASNGNFALTSALNIGAAATLTTNGGNVHFDGATDNAGLSHSIGFLTATSSTVRTLTFGTATLNLNGASGTIVNISNTANITLSAASASFVAQSAGTSTQTRTFTFGATVSGRTIGTLRLLGPAEHSITCSSGNLLTIGTLLERSGPGTAAPSGTASLSLALGIGGTVKITGTLKVHGDSAALPVIAWPGSNGIPAVVDVSAATLDLQYVNFQDITFKNGGVNLDLSGITGGSGDAGGNTISGGGSLTFTSPTTQTWQTTGGGSFSDVTKWTSRIPLPQDTVVLNNAFSGSPTVTLDMRWTGNVSFAGGSGNVVLAPSPISGANVVGNFTGRSGLTMTPAGSSFMFWNARASGVIVDLTGTTNLFNNSVSSSNGGDLTFRNTVIGSALQVRSGIVIVELGQTLEVGSFTSNATSSSAPADIRISGTMLLDGTGFVWTNVTAGAGLNICGEFGGKIVIGNNSASGKSFQGQGNTFTTLQGPSGTGGLAITDGGNTFTGSGLSFPSGGKLTLPGSVTTTLNAAASAAAFGNGTNTLTIVPSAGSATLSFAAAATPNHLALTNILAAGAGSPVHAGAASTDNGGNTNWVFP